MWLIKDTYSNYKANYKADMLNTKRNSYWLLQILKFCNLHTVFFLEKLVKKWKKRSLLLVVLLSCLCRKKIKIRWDNTTGKHETDLRFITRLSLIVLIFRQNRGTRRQLNFLFCGPTDPNFRQIKIHNNNNIYFIYISF